MGLLWFWGTLGGQLETGAVYLGLALGVLGLLAAQIGALFLVRPTGGRWFAIPVATFVIVAIPVYSDYLTSGLETGLSLFWLGSMFAITAWQIRGEEHSGTARRSIGEDWVWVLAAAASGLGFLIRPDLSLFSAAFLIALLLIYLRRPRKDRSRAIVAAMIVCFCLIPATYQIFRMGYYASLVPNTALAKEAGMAFWKQGLRYLRDFVWTYRLEIPVVIFILFTRVFYPGKSPGRSGHALLTRILLVTSILHAIYVVRVGGDFMHGRFLLPTFFAALMPFAVIAWPASWPSTGKRRVARAGLAILMSYCVICALFLRVSYQGEWGYRGISDERGSYASQTGNPNLVSRSDYADHVYGRHGSYLLQLADSLRATGSDRRAVLVALIDGKPPHWVPRGEEVYLPASDRVDESITLVAASWNIGVIACWAGPTVHIVDVRGLADPIAGRLRLAGRGHPGHEKA